MVIYFDLPLPPSVNHMYVGIGRHKSKFYKAWLKECIVAMIAVPAASAAPGSRWELTFTCTMPNWRKRDLDNTFKPLVDFLAWRLGLDDNRLVALAATKVVAGGVSGVTGEVHIG